MSNTSESSVPDEYEVERILAEIPGDEGTLYLVKWLGYPDNQCTWEPIDNFYHPDTLSEWRVQVERGDIPQPDELLAIQERMDAYAQQIAENASSVESSSQSSSEKSSEKATNVARTHDASQIRANSTPVNHHTDNATRSLRLRGTSNKAGQRFNNLRHQNNFAKLARREPTPDISQLELRATDQWPDTTTPQDFLDPRRKNSPEERPNPQVPARTERERMSVSLVESGRETLSAPNLSASRSPSEPSRQPNAVSPLSVQDLFPSQTMSSTYNGVSQARSTSASRYRIWNYGDLVIHLRFGAHAVGEVKISKLPSWFIKKMLALQERPSLFPTVHFNESNATNMAAFQSSIRNHGMTRIALGAIQPYEDTKQGTDSLGEYLEQNDLCTVWEYPRQEEGLIMVLYSCMAPGWQAFGRLALDMTDVRLHVAVFGKSRDARATDPTLVDGSLRWRGVSSSGMSQLHSRPDVSRRNSSLHSNVNDGSAKSAADELPLKPRALPLPTNLPVTFSADFNDILGAAKKTGRKPRVFISFAASHPAAAAAVKRWLDQHLTPRQIFADTEKHGWAEWQEDITTKLGIILFHDRDSRYCTLVDFHRAMRKSTSIFCYSISFDRFQLEHPDRNVVSMLFPRGVAVLITEDSVASNPEEVIWCLKWFEGRSAGKPRSWKLCLFPRAAELISLFAAGSAGDKFESYRRILEVLHRIQMRTLEARVSHGGENEDPYRHVESHPVEDKFTFIVSPPSVGVYDGPEDSDMSEAARVRRDDVLVEYFCGWAAVNASEHRIFVALDGRRTNETQHHSSHVYFQHISMFVADEKKKEAPRS